MSEFEATVNTWLEGNLEANPEGVKAYSFNLFELADNANAKFAIELIGAGSFSEDDPDWACDEVWVPAQRMLPIPTSFSGVDWKECLERMKRIVMNRLRITDIVTEKLKGSDGIGIGFVDGDLEILFNGMSRIDD